MSWIRGKRNDSPCRCFCRSGVVIKRINGEFFGQCGEENVRSTEETMIYRNVIHAFYFGSLFAVEDQAGSLVTRSFCGKIKEYLIITEEIWAVWRLNWISQSVNFCFHFPRNKYRVLISVTNEITDELCVFLIINRSDQMLLQPYKMYSIRDRMKEKIFS